MSDALIAPSYAEIARLHRHFRLLNGSPEVLEYLLARTPTPTGAELQTWLGVSQNRAAFEQLISAPAGMAAVAASSTAMAAVAASSTAMAAVAASSTAMAVVLDSATARAAVYDSTTAWDAIASSATARSALLARAQTHSTSSDSHVYPTGSGAGVRVAFIQQRVLSGATSYAGASADTYSTTVSSFIDRYVRVTGLTHRLIGTSSISEIKYLVMQ